MVPQLPLHFGESQVSYVTVRLALFGELADIFLWLPRVERIARNFVVFLLL